MEKSLLWATDVIGWHSQPSGWQKLMMCLYVPQNVPNQQSRRYQVTYTMGNKWLLKGQDNCQVGSRPATFQPLCNQSSNRSMAKQMGLLSRSVQPQFILLIEHHILFTGGTDMLYSSTGISCCCFFFKVNGIGI